MPDLIVPWRGGCAHRARAWCWLEARWPWPATLALGGDPWVKALAVTPAIAAATSDLVIVADADVWIDPDALSVAIDEVAAGAPWAIPHRLVHRLDAAGTRRVIDDGLPLSAATLAEAPYPGIEGGGIVIAHRELLEAIPLDPRFIGWGQEDQSWAMALRTLAGAPWRGTADLFHLWHPPQPRESRTRGNRDGWNLRRRYARARIDPAAMRQIIREAHESYRAAQSNLHDHPAIAVR